MSATYDFGTGAPGRVPAVWSLGSRTSSTDGRVLVDTYPWNSRSHSHIRPVVNGGSVPQWSALLRSYPGYAWSVMACNVRSFGAVRPCGSA